MPLVAAFTAWGWAGACTAGSDKPGGESPTSTTPGNGGGWSFDASTDSGNILGKDSACATLSDEATQVPVNMYIMFDKSGSMMGTKWSQSKAALEAFFQDQQSAGLKVAFRFFPHEGCDSNCNVTACSQPKVPLGELTEQYRPDDVQEQALFDAFTGVDPSGGTPLSAALEGALSWGANTLATAPNEKAVVVLVTDGEPTDCNDSESYIVSLAQNAFANSKIYTFAIGLEGSKEQLMDDIAAAGGTTDGFFIGNTDIQTDFLAALSAIRESMVACEFLMPESDGGKPIDPNRVNVIYTPGNGSEPTVIGQVSGVGACTADKGGWYYDDPVNPTTVILCPGTCTGIQADENAKIEILLGCETIPA